MSDAKLLSAKVCAVVGLVYAVALLACMCSCAGPNAGESLAWWEVVTVAIFGTLRKPWRVKVADNEPRTC